VEQLAQDTFFKAAMFLENYRPENSFVDSFYGDFYVVDVP